MAHVIDRTTALSRIVKQLRTIDPYRIVLFGSMAGGTTQEDSDIDIVVVTNDDFMPESYKEKSELYLRVSILLSEISKSVPIDLIVYTKPMYEKFKALGSTFSKEVDSRGVVLYEADKPGVA